MADFCQQCLIDMYGEDLGDMAGLCEPGYVVTALCETCGPTRVDHDGKCVTNCDLQHASMETITPKGKDMNDELLQFLRRSRDEIVTLQKQVARLEPKAEAYDLLRDVVGFIPKAARGYGEDIVWRMEQRIRELEAQPAAEKTAQMPPQPMPGNVAGGARGHTAAEAMNVAHTPAALD